MNAIDVNTRLRDGFFEKSGPSVLIEFLEDFGNARAGTIMPATADEARGLAAMGLTVTTPAWSGYRYATAVAGSSQGLAGIDRRRQRLRALILARWLALIATMTREFESGRVVILARDANTAFGRAYDLDRSIWRDRSVKFSPAPGLLGCGIHKKFICCKLVHVRSRPFAGLVGRILPRHNRVKQIFS